MRSIEIGELTAAERVVLNSTPSSNQLSIEQLTQYVSSPLIAHVLRLKLLKLLTTAIKRDINYSKRPQPTPTKKRFSKFNIISSFVLFGIWMFLDMFVSFSTMFSELLTIGMVLFGVSLGGAGLLMLAMLLMRLSSLVNDDSIDWAPPQEITQALEERKQLQELSTLIDSVPFDHAHRDRMITQNELTALRDMLTTRHNQLIAFATKLETKKNSYFLLFSKGVALMLLGAGSVGSGFSTGYFFVYGLTFCFPTLMFPVWLPLLIGIGIGLIALRMFWVYQGQDINRTIEWLFNCDTRWIERLSEDSTSPANTAFARLIEPDRSHHNVPPPVETPLTPLQRTLHHAPSNHHHSSNRLPTPTVRSLSGSFNV